MIVVKEFPDREFSNKEDLFKALSENKNLLIAQKKMITKQADAILHYVEVSTEKEETTKGLTNLSDVSTLKASLVINTTNLLDSHGDVHLKGIWTKSVKEQKNILLLQEHRMTFDHIISDTVQAKVKTMDWSKLGFELEGKTDALVFDTEIDKSRNEFMFSQYAKGYVKEHSVGMRYVKMDLALNSESEWYKEEKATWDKYFSEIANKEVADERGFFWAISEAKIVEGSAVVKGSNYATPTISIEAVKDTPNEPKEEPTQVTHETEKKLLKELLNKF